MLYKLRLKIKNLLVIEPPPGLQSVKFLEYSKADFKVLKVSKASGEIAHPNTCHFKL